MDISQARSILSRHTETRRLYSKELIRVTGGEHEIIIAGDYPDALLTALSALTEAGPLYTRFALVVDTWHAFITTPPTHVNVTTDRAVNSTIAGATINNLEPNQGVQGVFNTPIHIGKK